MEGSLHSFDFRQTLGQSFLRVKRIVLWQHSMALLDTHEVTLAQVQSNQSLAPTRFIADLKTRGESWMSDPGLVIFAGRERISRKPLPASFGSCNRPLLPSATKKGNLLSRISSSRNSATAIFPVELILKNFLRVKIPLELEETWLQDCSNEVTSLREG